MHYKSKEELHHQIARSGHQELAAVVPSLTAHHARADTDAHVINYELASLSPEHFAEIRELRQRIDTELRGLVEDGVATGDFRTPTPAMAAVAVLSPGIDIARWYREGSACPPEDIGDFNAVLALRIVGVQTPD